jgi:hypothetical protein
MKRCTNQGFLPYIPACLFFMGSLDLSYVAASIVPKGGVEKGETSGEAAVRESWEEGAFPAGSLNIAE